MNDTLLLPTPAFTDQDLHDVRAAHDMANLRFDAVAKGDEGFWIIIKIIPAPHSGSATTVGASIDLDSGKLIDNRTGKILTPDAAQPGIMEEGSWELVTSLSNSPTTSRGQYSWTEPRRTRIRSLEVEDLYRPFARGGVVLCRRRPEMQGSAQFVSAQLIPPGWEIHTRAAYEFFQRNPGLFAGSSLPSQRDRLLEMVRGDNPVLGVMAFRTMAEKGTVDIALLREVLGRFEGYRRVVLSYMIMAHPLNLNENTLLDELAKAIEGIAVPDEHRFFALGIATTRLLHPDLRTSQVLGPKLLTTLRRHTAQLGGGKGSPTYEQIQRRAYEISERRRSLGVAGNAREDWVQAERELRRE
jgi:hypothetical protein